MKKITIPEPGLSGRDATMRYLARTFCRWITWSEKNRRNVPWVEELYASHDASVWGIRLLEVMWENAVRIGSSYSSRYPEIRPGMTDATMELFLLAMLRVCYPSVAVGFCGERLEEEDLTMYRFSGARGWLAEVSQWIWDDGFQGFLKAIEEEDDKRNGRTAEDTAARIRSGNPKEDDRLSF